jgi:hypothetical protein
MLPLDFHTLSWNDFFVSGVFFIGDILVTAMLIPIFISIADRRKWYDARCKVGELSARYMDMLDFHFSALRESLSGYQQSFPEAFSENDEAYTAAGLEKQRQLLFVHLIKGIPELEKGIKDVTDSYLQEMQLLAPAFNSEIVIRQIRFYQASTRPPNLAIAVLSWWVVLGKDELNDIGVNPDNRKLEADAEDALKMLCMSVKLAVEDSAGRLFVPQYAAGREFTSLNRPLYPNNDPIFSSLDQIATILKSNPPQRLGAAETSEKPPMHHESNLRSANDDSNAS